ncbi:hypothetical protein [Ornithinimicrobium sufpigmenti]|nr:MULTISPECIES: hypothetical protein [unclassified Ornithinimicrobium]
MAGPAVGAAAVVVGVVGVVLFVVAAAELAVVGVGWPSAAASARCSWP